MCPPKAPKAPVAPQPLFAPLPVADAIKQPTDDLTIAQASRGASALSKGRSSLGGTSDGSGLGIS